MRGRELLIESMDNSKISLKIRNIIPKAPAPTTTTVAFLLFLLDLEDWNILED